MADAISAISSIQLGVLQSPEIAREQVPVALQAQLANAQASSVIARQQQQTLETVLELANIEGHGVPDALTGDSDREPPGYGSRQRRPLREPVQHRVETVAAADPRGVGATVDVRA
jgi:hypothetical protein